MEDPVVKADKVKSEELHSLINKVEEYDYSTYSFEDLVKDLEFLKKFYGSCMKFEHEGFTEREGNLYMSGYEHGISSFHSAILRSLNRLKEKGVLIIGK